MDDVSVMPTLLCGFTMVSWDRELYASRVSRVVSRGPHRVGIRAILTLGNPSLAWALDRTNNYFIKVKEMAIYIKGKYILLSSLPLFFKASFITCI
jgi:hypothetical protein